MTTSAQRLQGWSLLAHPPRGMAAFKGGWLGMAGLSREGASEVGTQVTSAASLVVSPQARASCLCICPFVHL